MRSAGGWDRLICVEKELYVKMDEMLGLAYMLEHITGFTWSDALFLPEDEVWDLKTKCMVLDPDDIEDDVPKAAKEKDLIYTLSIQTIQMICENVYEQKDDPSGEDLLEGFLYYFDHDAYMEF